MPERRALSLAADHVPENYDLAVEIIGVRRLKGYSDTHARGESKFERVIGAVPMLAGRADGADWLRRLARRRSARREGHCARRSA